MTLIFVILLSYLERSRSVVNTKVAGENRRRNIYGRRELNFNNRIVVLVLVHCTALHSPNNGSTIFMWIRTRHAILPDSWFDMNNPLRTTLSEQLYDPSFSRLAAVQVDLHCGFSRLPFSTPRYFENKDQKGGSVTMSLIEWVGGKRRVKSGRAIKRRLEARRRLFSWWVEEPQGVYHVGFSRGAPGINKQLVSKLGQLVTPLPENLRRRCKEVRLS